MALSFCENVPRPSLNCSHARTFNAVTLPFDSRALAQLLPLSRTGMDFAWKVILRLRTDLRRSLRFFQPECDMPT
jgi:hypothetical protein